MKLFNSNKEQPDDYFPETKKEKPSKFIQFYHLWISWSDSDTYVSQRYEQYDLFLFRFTAADQHTVFFKLVFQMADDP